VSTPPSGPSEGGAAPPPAPGPWASDNLPQHPMAAHPPVVVEQPQSIRTAVRLMYVGAAFSLLGLLLVPFQLDAIRDAIEDNDSIKAADVDSTVNVTVGSIIFFGLVGVGLWIWMAVKNGQGRSWARVVATVLGGLSVLSTLSGLAQGSTTALSLVLSLVGIALAAVILWFLYRPESSRFYDVRSR
jgi:hypothetical protein